MNDKEIIDIIDCIRNNDNLTTERTVDLIDKVMHDCKAKRIGEAIIEAVGKPKKRGRGRPRKSENQKQMLESIKQNGRAQDF